MTFLSLVSFGSKSHSALNQDDKFSAWLDHWRRSAIYSMKRVGWSFHFCWLLIIWTTSGCTTYDRETFLKSHSLTKFMADRPQAGKLLRQHAALEQWLATEWDRPIEDYRIFWSDEQPTASPMAEHAANTSHRLIVIRVSTGLAPVDQLLALAYEICNAQGRHEFVALSAQAAAGKISRDQFIHGKCLVEYAALLRLKEKFPKLLALSSAEVAATPLYRTLLQVPVGGFQDYQSWRGATPAYVHDQALYGLEFDQIVKKGQSSTPKPE